MTPSIERPQYPGVQAADPVLIYQERANPVIDMTEEELVELFPQWMAPMPPPELPTWP